MNVPRKAWKSKTLPSTRYGTFAAFRSGAEYGSGFFGKATIPAMLSPGEFVINARSARKFYSQLHAMNAGQQPAFRQNGGTVDDNSTTMGDVHVHSNPASMNELIKDMQRHIRRGTGRLD